MVESGKRAAMPQTSRPRLMTADERVARSIQRKSPRSLKELQMTTPCTQSMLLKENSLSHSQAASWLYY